MIEEKCENCEWLGEIYVPPRFCPKPIYLKGCFLFADEEKSVMYLNCTESLCECFMPKQLEGDKEWHQEE